LLIARILRGVRGKPDVVLSVSGSMMRAHQRHPLLLAAGEFGRIALRQRLELCGAKDRAELFRDGVAGLFCAGAS
jgi:hypothetical protein